MRIFALIVVAIFSFLSLGCALKLQPSAQGEWSSYHDSKDKISKDARPQEKQPEAK
jgi:hypothetical protein